VYTLDSLFREYADLGLELAVLPYAQHFRATERATMNLEWSALVNVGTHNDARAQAPQKTLCR
jgi:hypothetical protein